jgi:hypothetical protein
VANARAALEKRKKVRRHHTPVVLATLSFARYLDRVSTIHHRFPGIENAQCQPMLPVTPSGLYVQPFLTCEASFSLQAMLAGAPARHFFLFIFNSPEKILPFAAVPFTIAVL